MPEMVEKYNDITSTRTDSEIVNDDMMIKMIERGREGLEDYFGNEDNDDDYEDEEDQQQFQRQRAIGLGSPDDISVSSFQ